jgi:molybdenum cofactor cytidylyltransferase
MAGDAGPDLLPGRDRTPRIDAVVLAAGSSTRFGGQKLVADVGGVPLIRRTVEGILETKVREVRVVTGASEAEVRDALRGLRVAFTSNPEHAAGMGMSISAGVSAVPADCDAVVVVLGDQPTAGTLIDRLVDEFVASRAPIVVPEFEDVRGPPALFGRECFGALMSLAGDTGARAFIAENPALVRVLAMEGRAPPDIDTRADAQAFDRHEDRNDTR